MTIRIGTSGWVYNHWRGIFYPRDLSQRDWFAYYAREFNTVEINNAFYRLPSDAAVDTWREQAPPGFLYVVKASRFLTHMKKLKDPEEPLRTFFARVRRLDKTLGPVLYQLPPNWQVNLSRLEHFLAVLPKGYTHVVEFRDESWLIDDVFRLMERYHVAHCIHDMYPLKIPMRITAPLVYFRFHGDVTHGGDYPVATLKTWAKRIANWRGEKRDVFVCFNNDINGYALKNATMLKRLLGGS